MTNTRRSWLPLVIAVVTVLLPHGLAAGQSQDQSSPSAPQAESGPQAPAHISSGVTSGLLIRRVNPQYPKKARKKHIQGTVILKATINKDGDIADLVLVSGDPLLAKAAMDAVRQWKYKPYLFQGRPVEVQTPIQVNFTLSGY